MPATEVRESQMSIMRSTRKGCHSCAARNCLDAEYKFISNFATVEEEMKYYGESGSSSNKHISHGQVYNQVHGTSAKIAVLYKKNN